MHDWNYDSEFNHPHLLDIGVKHFILVWFVIPDRSVSFEVMDIPALNKNTVKRGFYHIMHDCTWNYNSELIHPHLLNKW